MTDPLASPPRPSDRSPYVGPASATGALAVGLGAVALRDPHVAGNWPVCPFTELTGLLCPFCGGTRSMHLLTHGQFVEALTANVFAVGALGLSVYLIVRAVDQARRGASGSRLPNPLESRWFWTVGAVLLGVFWIVRNVPGFEFLNPPPLV